jgi:peptidoglycan/LPS O-acetylase OafA/YrhL
MGVGMSFISSKTNPLRLAAAETQGKPGAVFYPRLEALRGGAALMVAAFHACQSTWFDSEGKVRNFLYPGEDAGFVSNLCASFLRIAGNGNGAVVLFFVISGFVLASSLLRGPQSFAGCGARFLNARMFRIYPAVFIAVGVFALVFWLTGASLSGPSAYSPLGLLRNALLLDFSIDGVMWSLQLEVAAVPLIFVAYLGWRRCGAVVLVLSFSALAGLSFWEPWNRLIGAPNLFGEIYAFVFGMAAFLVGPRLVALCSSRVASVAFAGAAGLFLSSRMVISPTSHWSPLAEAASATIMVAILAFGRLGSEASIFDHRLIRFFGRISYSFYLLHPLTLLIIWKIPSALGAAIAVGVPAALVAAFLIVASIVVVTPFSYAMYRWIEIPGIIAGHKFGDCLSKLSEQPGQIAGNPHPIGI